MGGMECWSIGVMGGMEEWSGGVLGYWGTGVVE